MGQTLRSDKITLDIIRNNQYIYISNLRNAQTMKLKEKAYYRFYESKLVYDTANHPYIDGIQGIGYYYEICTKDVPDNAEVMSGFWKERKNNYPLWVTKKVYSGKEFKQKFYTERYYFFSVIPFI